MTRRARSRLRSSLFVAGASVGGCAATAPPTGVVVITLDTTRADRLSPYGFMNVSLPALERLAREGVVFDAATSVAPITLPAHTSLFTGLRPPRHGVRDNADSPLAERFTTLAESLTARGFRTAGFVSSIVLDPDRGLAQGFQTYAGVAADPTPGERRRQRRGDAVVDDALEWIEHIGDRPYFLWVHLYDAHRPYDPPEPYATTYAHNLYVGEIAFADSQVGRLIDGLERRKLLDRSVVVVAGDHGESLGERGERDHGIFIYENVLRVPLIMRAPGLAPGRVGDVVRLTDVMPTILDLLDVPAPAADLDGISLVPLMSGQAANLDLEAFAESVQQERFGWSALARAARRPVQGDRRAAARAVRPGAGSLRRNEHLCRPAGAGRRDDRARRGDQEPGRHGRVVHASRRQGASRGAGLRRDRPHPPGAGSRTTAGSEGRHSLVAAGALESPVELRADPRDPRRHDGERLPGTPFPTSS